MTIAKKVEEFKKKFKKYGETGESGAEYFQLTMASKAEVIDWLETSLREVEEEAKKEVLKILYEMVADCHFKGASGERTQAMIDMRDTVKAKLNLNTK